MPGPARITAEDFKYVYARPPAAARRGDMQRFTGKRLALREPSSMLHRLESPLICLV